LAVIGVLTAALVVAAFSEGWLSLQDDDSAHQGISRSQSAAPSDGASTPASSEPESLLPEPGLVAEPRLLSETGVADPERVRRALVDALAVRELGRHLVVRVANLSDGATLFRQGAGSVVPASTVKLLTAVAALSTLGPQHVFTTSVVEGSHRNEVVLVGGGDPILGRRPSAADEGSRFPLADVTTLAQLTATRLKSDGRLRVHVGFDASLFTGPPGAASWENDYLTDGVVSPISALWVDEGRQASGVGRVRDPARAAAAAFARALSREGIRITAVEPMIGELSADVLAEVASPPLEQIVERVIAVSDNEAAEVLAHHVGLVESSDASFTGGAQASIDVVRRLGVPTQGSAVYDGSGLSRADRLSPDTLIGLLRLAAADEHPELRSVVNGLPVAGFTGSLSDRFTAGQRAGAGWVRAKTGTLSGVSGLAGLVRDRDGTILVFVAVADRVALADTLAARSGLDAIGAALAACHCS
jgi:D-alanyl-D-alanine carboxypeptidase/D-alanyl-D-alanine-endopeptidase (penicillin-binding protein 4)